MSPKRKIASKNDDISKVLSDKKLAKLGDSYINFVYSLALSRRIKEPVGEKVKGEVLAEALKKTELRKLLPRRIDKHAQANAVEAFVVYAWLQKFMTLEDCVKILEENIEDPIEAFKNLLQELMKRLDVTE